MSKVITDSSNISVLDSKIVVDLCAGNFMVDLSPSIFLGVGASNIQGAKVRIVNPYNVIVKDFTSEFDISAPLTSVFQFGIPTENDNFQYGEYMIEVQITDADGSTYTVGKSVAPCYPDVMHKDRDYGSLSASIKGICREGKVLVAVDNVPTYNGIIASGSVQSFTFEYPNNTRPSRTSVLTYFSDTLFEGIYKLTGELCANYIGSDNVSYKVNYRVKAQKQIYCQIDECAVFGNFVQIHRDLDHNCSEERRLELSNKLLEGLALLNTAKMANECGEDASDYISQLEGLLGCKCSCGLEGTPITTNAPSGDVVIDGCNVVKSQDGLTTHYQIDNYAYQIEVAPNGGHLTASSPTLVDCTYKQTLTFDVSKIYNEVKNNANSNTAEQSFWAGVVNKALDGINVTCLGSFGTGWASMTLTQRMAAIKDAACVGVNITIPEIPPPTVIPDNVNGAAGYLPLFSGATFGAASKAIGNSLATQQNGQIVIPVLAAANSSSAFPYALAVTKVQPLNNSGNLLGAQSELHITGSGLVQTNELMSVANFGVLYIELTGNSTVLGYQHSGVMGSLAGKASNATIASPMLSAIAAVADFSNNGHYQKVAGLFVDRPGNGTSGGGPAFSGTIDTWYGVFIASSVNGGLTTAVVKKYGIYQQGENDPNIFAGKTSFSINLIDPTSNVHIKGLGYEQLRLENAFTPTGPSDSRGAKGDHAWDNEYLYWKVELGGGVLRWNRTRRDTTWVDPT